MKRLSWMTLLLLVSASVSCGGGGSNSGTDTASDLADASGDLVPDGYVIPCETDGDCVPESTCHTGTCVQGYCQFPWKTDGEACDDGNPCTTEDKCTSGECSDAVVKACSDGNPCNGVETCDEKTGQCVDGPLPDLDDKIACTVDECDEETGTIVHAPSNQLCSDLDGICKKGECDPSQGCLTVILKDTECNDEDACTVDDKCDADGACSGTPKDCSNGVFCDGLETCNAADGQCIAGLLVIDDNTECTDDSCDDDLDLVKNIPDHTKCEDNNPCTTNTCVSGTGCVSVDNMDPCDDGDICTDGDVCTSGFCISGTQVCTPEICDNEIDDDDNGFADCLDEVCLWHLHCLPPGEDCLSAYPLNHGEPLELNESATFEATNAGKSDEFEASCVPFSGGKDTVHQISVTAEGLLALSATPGGPQKLVIALLSDSCTDELGCRIAENGGEVHAAIPVLPGDYFVVLDGAGIADAGPYTLTVSLLPPATTEADCAGGIDEDKDGMTDCFDLDCQGSEECGEPDGDGCDSPLPVAPEPIGSAPEPVIFVLTGDTTTMTADVAGSCEKATQAAKDMVYWFEISVPLRITIEHAFDNSGAFILYPAVYLLDRLCQFGQEIGCTATKGDPAIISKTLQPGVYYVVVDAAWASDSGEFTLTVQFDDPPTTEVVCANEEDEDGDMLVDCDDPDCDQELFCVGFPGDNCAQAWPVNDGEPVTSALAGTVLTYTGTTVGFLDQYEGPCSEDSGEAPDSVYRMELADTMAVTITHDFDSFFFPALYIWKDTCGKPDTVLYCDEDTDTASISTTLAPGVYYIVLDASYPDDASFYSLTIDFGLLPTTEVECGNLIDDDGDGFTDCDDEIDCMNDLYCKDPYEPNNSRESAATLPFNGSYWEVLAGTSASPATDRDFYQIGLSGKGFVKIHVLPDTGLNLLARLLDSAGNTLVQSETSGVTGEMPPLVYGFAAAGQVYLEVYSPIQNLGIYNISAVYIAPTSTELDCGDGLDNDLDSAKDCSDSDCASDFVCVGETCEEAKIINSGAPISYIFAGLNLHYVETTGDNEQDYMGSCHEETSYAKDEVYAFTLESLMRATITADFVDTWNYPALYIFKDSCTAASEVACDFTLGLGGPARLENLLLDIGTYYVVMDAAYSTDSGNYYIDFLFALPASTEVDCADGVDNEGDGFADCCDSECSEDPSCVAETSCTDGNDNDCDTLVDCLDSDCALDLSCMGENCGAPVPVNNGTAISKAFSGQVLHFLGDTSTAKAEYASGSCETTPTTSAKDEVYKIILADPMIVDVQFDFIQTTLYPAVYIYQESCETQYELACAATKSAGGPALIPELVLQPGTYFVIVDAAASLDAGLYKLDLSFTAPSEIETDCTDGIDNDADLALDCCDADCDGNKSCYEWGCGDLRDNDCNGFMDCDDVQCQTEIECTGYLLPWPATFEDVTQEGILPDLWVPDGPNEKCRWEAISDGNQSSWSMYIHDAYGCSTVDSYEMYSPLLDITGCDTLVVHFKQKAVYPTYHFYHSVGVLAGGDKDEISLGPATADWAPPTEPIQFDVTGNTQVRVYWGYRGDFADRWYIDDIEVLCLAGGLHELDCGDGLDNDNDFAYDCCDNDCKTAVNCEEICGDSLDNDCDGNTDCCDIACQESPSCAEICGDAYDNDCDGIVDCCDGDCKLESNCLKEFNCNDGLDLECDGKTDCQDSDCAAYIKCLPEICNNNKDDNDDGKSDCLDEECFSSPLCTDADGDTVKDAYDICPGGNDLVDSDNDNFPDDCEIGWMGKVWPNNNANGSAGQAFTIYVRVYKAGVTDKAGRGNGISVKMKYKKASGSNWIESSMVYNADKENDDEYMASIDTPLVGNCAFFNVDFKAEFITDPPSTVHFWYNNVTIKDQAGNSVPLTYKTYCPPQNP